MCLIIQIKLFSLFDRTLRKLLEDNDEDWDDYLDGVLLAINTNTSTTTKYSPFYLMYGRNPLLPIQSEMVSKHPIPSFIDEDLQQQQLSHIESLKKLQDEIFPKVSTNITDAQEKQKQQYQKKKGMISCPFKNKDLVLRRNMLQKTKMGHKMEDNWLGPYEVVDLDLDKGTWKLQSKKTGQVLKRRVPMKQLKPYIQSELKPNVDMKNDKN